MTCRRALVAWLGGSAAIALLAASSARASKSPPSKSSVPDSPDFIRDVKPLLAQYCYGCHGEKKKGDLDLRLYRDDASVRRDLRVFEKVLRNLQSHEMPPENKPQPSAAERERVAQWATSFFST